MVAVFGGMRAAALPGQGPAGEQGCARPGGVSAGRATVRSARRAGYRRSAAAILAAAGLFLSAGGASAQLFGNNNTANQLSNMSVRLDSTESQMRALNGQIEQLSHQIMQLQQQIQQMQELNEFRFQQLEGGKGGTPAKPMKKSSLEGGPPPAGGAGTDVAALPADGFSPQPEAAPPTPGGAGPVGTFPAAEPAGSTAAAPSAPGSGPLDLTALIRANDPSADVAAGAPPADPASTAGLSDTGAVAAAPPANLGTLPASDVPGVGSPTYTPPAGTQVAAVPGPSSAPATPRTAYDEAYGYVMRGDYVQAESAFRRFLASYPGDKLEPDAQYWLGESLYSRGNYRDAATAFLEGYTQHPESRKAPDSLFKLGLSLNGMGEKSAACASYKELLSRYPSASAALRDRVRAEQKTAGC